MKFLKFSKNEEYDVKVYFVEKDASLDFLAEEVREYAKETGFDGSYKKTFKHIGPGTSNVILVGMGEEEEIGRQKFRNAGFVASKFLNKNKFKSATFNIGKVNDVPEYSALQCTAEGIYQASYSFDEYKTEKCENSLEKISFETEEEIEPLMEYVDNIVEGVFITRDLVNTPSIDMYPEILAQKAVNILEPLGIKVTVYGEKELEEMGMTAILAVGQGSDRESKFVVMEYLPQGEDVEAIALVGKGMCYDSGGYAIKPPASMASMKTDMAGAGTVIGAMSAIAKNKLDANVVGVMALTENMIDGSAYKNGDIVKTKKGTTIEVLNTDAEGRVTLADSLYYAATQVNSKCIIDLATLTGACIVALGAYTTGAITNNDELFEEVKTAGDFSGEYTWKLPQNEHLRDNVKGQNADLTNSVSKGGGGAITAGIFLEHFVEDKPWVHLDIAGPSWADSAYGYQPNGATGIPVKTIHNFVANQAKK